VGQRVEQGCLAGRRQTDDSYLHVRLLDKLSAPVILSEAKNDDLQHGMKMRAAPLFAARVPADYPP
jgi:hypothetical protein